MTRAWRDQNTYRELLGPLGHTGGPLGETFVYIHEQFSPVEELTIQLLDRKRHLLHRAQIYKCKAEKEGERGQL